MIQTNKELDGGFWLSKGEWKEYTIRIDVSCTPVYVEPIAELEAIGYTSYISFCLSWGNTFRLGSYATKSKEWEVFAFHTVTVCCNKGLKLYLLLLLMHYTHAYRRYYIILKHSMMLNIPLHIFPLNVNYRTHFMPRTPHNMWFTIMGAPHDNPFFSSLLFPNLCACILGTFPPYFGINSCMKNENE